MSDIKPTKHGVPVLLIVCYAMMPLAVIVGLLVTGDLIPFEIR